MKVLILACLVALALAKETLESLSNSEESITQISKQKLEKAKHVQQQQREDELQDKIHPFIQSQPLAYSDIKPIPYTVPQSILPIPQPAMVPVLLPAFEPEIVKAKDTILLKNKEMPFLKSSTGLPVFNPQIPDFTNLKYQQLLQLLLQPSVHQTPKSFLQTPLLQLQFQQHLLHPQALSLLQQVVPFLVPEERAMLVPQLLQHHDLLDLTHQPPVTQPLDSVYSRVVV
uniref:Beta-casein n=1 Tax=Castor canadensis TaxID=51338 RepID=A0A8C0WR25_CASCN